MGRHTFGPPRLLLCVVATTCLGACSGGLERSGSPCPSGQDLREERHDDATSIKSRGCVGPDGEREGLATQWYDNGQKAVEGEFKNGRGIFSLVEYRDPAEIISELGARNAG